MTAEQMMVVIRRLIPTDPEAVLRIKEAATRANRWVYTSTEFHQMGHSGRTLEKMARAAALAACELQWIVEQRKRRSIA